MSMEDKFNAESADKDMGRTAMKILIKPLCTT
jgi:hypothetical protein